MATEHWITKALEDLNQLSKEQLVEKIIKKRKKDYSKVGKRNVATSKTHERRCKKLLTEWTGTEFRRRRIEGRGDDVTVVEGVADIIPVEGSVIVAIESKKGANFSLDGLFTNPHGSKFTEWWHQVNYDAQLLTEKVGEKRWPMLFFKPIPAWDWIALPSRLFRRNWKGDDPLPTSVMRPKSDISNDELQKIRGHFGSLNSGDGSDCWFPHIEFDTFRWLGPVEHNIAASNKNKVMMAIELEPCIMCRWRDFANNVDPRSIFVEE